MVKTLSEVASVSIREAIDKATADKNKIPGLVAIVVGKDGELMFSHASGTRGKETQEPMTLDSTFWMASCTKMIGGIAVMQLCEQGKLALDDPDLVESIAPELKSVRILKNVDQNGKAEYVEKKNRITLRMLLTHTAGFGYTFFNEKLRQWSHNTFNDEFDGLPNYLSSPLLFEPGTKWVYVLQQLSADLVMAKIEEANSKGTYREYGIGIDWAGTIVERVSGMSLNDYFQQNVFRPLGVKNINMFPSQSMKDTLAYMHQKDTNGNIFQRNHLLRRPLVVDGEAITQTYNSAGAGCYARPIEYCEILATLLNCGTSPTTGAQILKPETVGEMFTNHIPNFPNFGRQGIPAARPLLTNPLPDLYPTEADASQGWGLTMMLTNLEGGLAGRGQGTGHWAGLANLFWWCDPKKEVAGMLATQILPFGDPNVVGLWLEFENLVYQGLEEKLGKFEL
ncbi:MAG: hypothetical protein HETSPECPRED_006765 [Heterodermia speciosa]|uniref:Beta-lactamase-related domain-containing protein n=1 Tax=Heterodermia speciosa TaxID=116794 RepID=A0A8H3IQW7_9LECA|nr:MAG: hypothetical protein HETSPECPRED_006765 [Heterodermia speciosa]